MAIRVMCRYYREGGSEEHAAVAPTDRSMDSAEREARATHQASADTSVSSVLLPHPSRRQQHYRTLESDGRRSAPSTGETARRIAVRPTLLRRAARRVERRGGRGRRLAVVACGGIVLASLYYLFRRTADAMVETVKCAV